MPEGLPVGIQVIVPFLSDLRVLRLAELFVAAAGTALSEPRN
jgi:Asp-tRNA(Asn)/Glu-tRNA(Gln) amidotransferase A subunit family amidase